MQIGGDDGVEGLRLQGHAHGHGVDEHLVPGHVGIVLRHFGGDLVPHDHAVPLRVRLGHDGEKLARPRARHLERKPHDARDAGAGEDRDLGRDLLRAVPGGSARPGPAYSPSEFSRTITQSRSFAATLRRGLSMPGRMRVGRTLAY